MSRGEPRPETAAGALPFSVVLPALDEEHGLVTTLAAIRAALADCPQPYELIVVDDGSTDGTARVLAACQDVTVLRHERTRGYGAALKTGIRAARHPLVVVIDADGTYAAAAIPALVARCATADMVVGARIGANVQSTPLRSTVKWGFRQFAQWITQTRIPDLNSGLRVFQRTVAERCMDLLPDGFSFTTTITVSALVDRRVVHFEPVDYLPRIGRSKVRPLRDTWRIGRQLLRLGLRLAPQRTSVALAAPLVLISAGSWAADLVRAGAVAADTLGWLAGGIAVLGIGARAELRLRRHRDRGPATARP